ncbi:oxygenase MpaB family protein [Actinomadura madurae]|uniref:oxygenase MpaB family protein n=1 Tax=Actinomadura madurae TaxID=1993 RepID=UPI0026E5524A
MERYYREFVRVGEALGGTGLPATKAEVAECLESYLPRLAVTPIKAFATGPNLRDGKVKPWEPGSPFMDWAARDMLPEWARKLVLYRPPNPVTLRLRRTTLWFVLNALHDATGPLPEFRQAEARVAKGVSEPVASTAPTAPRPRPHPPGGGGHRLTRRACPCRGLTPPGLTGPMNSACGDGP